MVALARSLRGTEGRAPSRSLRMIAADLAARGYVTPSGKTYSASAVASMMA
jgi:hypothetical protein